MFFFHIESSKQLSGVSSICNPINNSRYYCHSQFLTWLVRCLFSIFFINTQKNCHVFSLIRTWKLLKKYMRQDKLLVDFSFPFRRKLLIFVLELDLFVISTVDVHIWNTRQMFVFMNYFVIIILIIHFIIHEKPIMINMTRLCQNDNVSCPLLFLPSFVILYEWINRFK